MLKTIIPLAASLTALISTVFLYAIWTKGPVGHWYGMLAKVFPVAASLSVLFATLYACVTCS